jgi:hypothetical protein
MLPLNWLNIRSYNNSQNNAFEELVCQLAREEKIQNKASFIRVGAPDGGVEAYCILKNGDEYGWQAKYFDSMGDSQWNQLEKSFKTALEKHPRLVKYYICIPLDRQDPRIDDQKWFMDKWNEKVEEWTNFALEHGRNIEFEFWGSSELIARLSQEKHAGRTYFWFNKEQFSQQWFSERLNRSIDCLGNRYTPELNFELDILKVFDGIARDDGFKKQFDNVYDELLKKASKALNMISEKGADEIKRKISKEIDNLVQCYKSIPFNEMNEIRYDEIEKICNSIEKKIYDCINYFYKLRDENSKENDGKADSYSGESTKFSSEIHYLRDFRYSLNAFQDFISSSTAILANTPVMILRGEAGIGKSHLLADIAKRRILDGKPSILLLGQHFTNDENPWTQILKNQLRLDMNEDEFLGALDAKAQSIGSRVLVIIDAINEGRGRFFWKDHIKGFIRAFEKYKWVGLVLSIRTSYEEIIVPRNMITEDIAVRVTHYGFADVEYEAAKLFFDSYKIQQPNVPLLHPEFQNPLFLKLFCEGLNKAGLTTIPDGFEGITKIIDFFITGINDRLSEPSRFDYSKKFNLVKKAISAILAKRMESRSQYITYDDAYRIVSAEVRDYTNNWKSFLNELINEGVLTQNVFWMDKSNYVDVVYFAYERFDDHLTTSYLLDKYLDNENPVNSFKEGQALYEYVKDEMTCQMNKGIIEALSIQLPEKVNKELYEIAPFCKSFYPAIEAFVESLLWRKVDTINDKTILYINQEVIKLEGTRKMFWDTILQVASNPKHYFNGDRIHRHLMQYKLADRDAWWTIYINQNFVEQSAIKRLIDWAWTTEDRSYISDESIRLSAITISWFLTSSNRYLRDSATKALVCLLENRIKVLIKVLKAFEKVNDPYVYERLYAVAYGCALRTECKQDLKELSMYVYKTIFRKINVYPHILLRDYARGIIEYSLSIGLDINVNVKRIRPPYKSLWIKELPTNQEIDKFKYDYKSEDFKDNYWSVNTILSSMTTEYGRGIGGYGDFGRYVFQSAVASWKDFDPQLLSNAAVKRIFELGYDAEKHGYFDRHYSRYGNGRSGHKAERIGKKYQWIAFHEILAKLADNFPMYDMYYFKKEKRQKYEGPWEPGIRDIDPTIIIKKTGKDKYNNSQIRWWLKETYNRWELDNDSWVYDNIGLPDFAKIILVNDLQNVEWFSLHSYPQWSEPEKLGEDEWDNPRKDLRYYIKSYLVPKNQLKKVFNVACKTRQGFNDWNFDMRNWSNIFYREYYWSPSCVFMENPYYGYKAWQSVYNSKGNYIGRVAITSQRYTWSEEYDCSKEDTISFLIPNKIIFEGMKMKYSKEEGKLLNDQNQLICFDPSVYNESPSSLLIRKDEFLDFLGKNDLSVVWKVIGEKMIIGGRNDNHKRLTVFGAYYYNGERMVGNVNSIKE